MEAGSASDCAIGVFVGLHGQQHILKNSDLAPSSEWYGVGF
jgi:hypothetical protein